jgi:hypothetical protein
MKPFAERGDTPYTAVLTRHYGVDVTDISQQGCRFHGRELLAIGDVGVLSATIGGQLYAELFRVSRSHMLPGLSILCEAGVEFLPIPSGGRFLRDIASRIDGAHAAPLRRVSRAPQKPRRAKTDAS